MENWNVKVGDQIQNLVSHTKVVIHDILPDGEIIAIASVVIPTTDLHHWLRVNPGGELLKLTNSKPENLLDIGDFIRRQDQGDAYIVSDMGEQLVFANRTCILWNPKEWDKL